MKRILTLLIVFALCAPVATARNVTVHAVNQPAATVFRSIVEQTGMNFVYSSDLLKDVKVTVDARNKDLGQVLTQMFSGTSIEYKIKGKNILLKRKTIEKPKKDKQKPKPKPKHVYNLSAPVTTPTMLDEVIIVSRLEESPLETSEIGAKKVSPDEVRNTPVILGEADVVKTLQTQPGVTEGLEGMAGMYIHGGNADENLYMLDNVALSGQSLRRSVLGFQHRHNPLYRLFQVIRSG